MKPQWSHDDLMEELTVQEVILGSLLQEYFEGVEERRAEARREIGILKRRLRELGKNSSPAKKTSSSPIRKHEAVASCESPKSPTLLRPELPQARQQSPRSMDPSRQDGPPPADWDTGSRKRDGTLADLPGRLDVAKRQMTPVPRSNRFDSSPFGSPSSGSEIIDLTGTDVDQDSTIISEQIKQESRHKQEKNDLEMALRISSQEAAPSPSTSAVVEGSNQAGDAFARMMATQQANGVRAKDEWSDENGDDKHVLGSGSGSASYMSGASVPRREGTALASIPPYMAPPPRLPALASGFNAPDRPPHLGAPNSSQGTGLGAVPSWAVLPSQRLAVRNNSHGMYLPPPPNGFTLGSSTPTVTLPSSTGLGDLIAKTNVFDYASGVDEFGTPLPDRLMTYLQEASEANAVSSISEKDLDDLLGNIGPDVDVTDSNREGTPEGLRNRLYPHQTLAVTWMKKMEEGTNKGGILADDMGLGKTISTLALILSRQAKSRPKTNVIIGPLALIRQWEDEISKKIKSSHRLSVFVYHNKKATTEDFLKYDVVLTTYGTVAQEFNRLEKFHLENADRSFNYDDKSISTKFPLLHPGKANFHRIILDEAQCIKNVKTKTAKACHQLKAKYRWCLTGTPMMNGVGELYSLVHFLRIRPYCSWDKFRVSFGTLFGKAGDSKSVAMNRLRALLKAIMLRRKKDSKIDNKPILVLPPKTEEVIHVDLSQDERDFYDQLEKLSQVQFSKYLRDGSIGKNYSHILVLLLRLRQACCHPHLNLDVDDAAPLTTNTEMIEMAQKLNPKIVTRVKATGVFECPICYDFVQAPWFFFPCAHCSCSQCLTRLADNARSVNLQEGRESDTAKCPVCRTSFDPKKCFTYTAFQKVHMPSGEYVKDEGEGEGRVKDENEDETDTSDDDDDDDDDDDEDDEPFKNDFDDDVDDKGNLKGFIDDGFFDSEDQEDKKENVIKTENMMKRQNMIKKEKKNNKKRKNKDKGKAKEGTSDIKPSMLKALRKDAAKSRAAYKKYMGYLKRTWLPAAKVSECIRLLVDIREKGGKTIVFSQWTLLLDLIEVGLRHEQYKGDIRRYDGGMTGDERFASTQEFRDSKTVSVMLVSLRAGNAGLNLTAASNVVIMDPFWNPYIERQAIDRAYRIGQLKEVKVYRILTKDTVEDRIIELQERKQEMVEAALDEAEGVKISKLGVNQLKFLFNTGR